MALMRIAMLITGLSATTLVVLAACVGAGHPVHAEWTPPEELADLDREVAQGDPEEAMALRRKRWFGVSSILIRLRLSSGFFHHAGRCAMLAISVLIERLPSTLRDVALVVPEERQTIHARVRALDQ